jgi:flagellar motor protein MotB
LGSHQALSGSNAGQQQQQQMASHGNGAQQQQQQQSGSNIPQQSQQQQGKQQQQQRETGSVLDSRGSTKPKQAGNLFDVIKSEMLQLKLDQGKVAKRLDSLGKRSTDVEALAALLQQQQAHFQAQLEGLSARLDALATAHAQAELRRELQQSSHAAAGSTGGPGAGAAGSAFGSVHQHHPQGTVNPDEFDVMGNEPAVRSQLCPKPVAASGMAPSGVLPLLYQPLYQWSVVAALAVTAPLGLPFLLQSNNSSFPKGARLLVCCLAVVNGLLAVVLSVWLVVLRVGWAVPALVSDLAPQQLVVIPVHRMLGAGSP